MQAALHERETSLGSALCKQTQEVDQLQGSVQELLTELASRQEEQERRQALAEKEKEALMAALEKAYDQLANVHPHVNASTRVNDTDPTTVDPESPPLVGTVDDEVTPVSVEGDVSPGLLANCTIVQCGIGRLSEWSFAFTWTMVTDPLSLTADAWEKAKVFIEDYFAVLSITLGLIISFISSNFIIYFFRRF